MPERHPTTGAILAFLAATFFGISGVVAGGVFETVEPAYVAQARSIIAAVVRMGASSEVGFWRLRLSISTCFSVTPSSSSSRNASSNRSALLTVWMT